MKVVSRRDWYLIFALLFIVWSLDRMTKISAADLVIGSYYGPLGLILHHNYGAMLGLFSQKSPILRVVTLSTGGGFLLFCFIIIQYFLPIRAMILRFGLALLLGGILGNVVDRIVWGYVVDFLVLRVGKLSTGVFNLADLVQWIGYLMIIYSLIKEQDELWPQISKRGDLWINPSFQLKYCLILVTIGFVFAVISGIFFYTFLRVTVWELVGPTDALEKQFLIPFLLTFLAISFTFLIMLFVIGKRISHQMAGPLYSFERFVINVLEGKAGTFQVRRTDDFPSLVELAHRLQRDFEALRKKTEQTSQASGPNI